MRFLLRSSATSVSRSTVAPIRSGETSFNHNNHSSETLMKAFGQQCSNNCGCSVRFEVNINADQDYKIIHSSYHAVQFISTMNNKEEETRNPKYTNPTTKNSIAKRQLYPLYTQSANQKMTRPMIKECTCSTLHQLASEITNKLPNMTLAQAQNQLEFTGSRSSHSFRYTVLRDLLTSRSKAVFLSPQVIERHSSCYDLVEEAIIATLKGYLPQPRRSIQASMYHGASRGSKLPGDQEEYITFEASLHSTPWVRKDRDMDPLHFVKAAKRRWSLLSTRDDDHSTDTMPAFHMEKHYETLYDKNEEEMKPNKDESSPMDWVSYVDEMYREKAV